MSATPFLVSACALVPALALSGLAACRGNIARRFAAAQLASTVTVVVLILLTFAIDQPSSIDLALTLVVLSLPASLLTAVFLERWL